MSKWKALSHSDGKFTVGKYSDRAPSHPFTISYQGSKVRYSEGDEIASVVDYRFNLDFTCKSLDDRHFPCGYWHKDYIPPFTVVYTSLLYPLEVVDGLEANINIISGIFRYTTHTYTATPESINTNLFDITSGIFRSIVQTYEYVESLQTSTFDMFSGKFKLAIYTYTIPVESVSTNLFDIVAGRFRDSVINYDYALPENVQTTVFNIIGGSHAN